jgi:hypothetical protein
VAPVGTTGFTLRQEVEVRMRPFAARFRLNRRDWRRQYPKTLVATRPRLSQPGPSASNILPRILSHDKRPGMPQDLRDVDPRELRLPSRRGADPFKLQRQIARFGASADGMPSPWVYEASDGVLVLYNGITRSTRIARLAPGSTIRVEVVGRLRRAYAGEPKVGDFVP